MPQKVLLIVKRMKPEASAAGKVKSLEKLGGSQ